MGYLRDVKLQLFGDFPGSFLLLTSDLILLWSENILCMISILLHLLRFILWPRIYWQMFCVHLKRIHILLLLGRMVCKYQVKLVMKLPQSSISLLILCLIFKEFFKWETKAFYIYSHTYHFWCFLFPCGHPTFCLASFSFCLKALLSRFWKNWSAGDKIYPVAGVVGAQTLWPCWALGALLPAPFLRPLNTPHLETPALVVSCLAKTPDAQLSTRQSLEGTPLQISGAACTLAPPWVLPPQALTSSPLKCWTQSCQLRRPSGICLGSFLLGWKPSSELAGAPICFLSLGHHRPMQPVIQCLKITVSCVLSGFLI